MILDNLLKQIFEFLYAATFNYGVSIALLSFVVSVMMLPLYWCAEKLQNRETKRKSLMRPALDKIKHLQNRQEKYYYKKEIFRKHNYKSYYSLTGLVGLAIQVPFFIAAFLMLKNYTPLNGISFGPINDLMRPDALITIGGLRINVLPFLMTFVNLFGVAMISKTIEKVEVIQHGLIALVFLVLLYESPAALVLYWTMNNAFSLGKTKVLNSTLVARMDKILFDSQLAKFAGLVFLFVKKNSYIFAILLFASFPLLEFFYTNIHECSFPQVIPILLVVLITTFLLSLIARVIYRIASKVVIFSFMSIGLFFSFGHIFDLIDDSYIDFPTARPVLLMVYTLIVTVCFFILLKIKRNLERLSKTLQIFSLCITIVVFFNITSYNINTKYNLDAIVSQKEEVSQSGNAQTNLDRNNPDIYFIVLDGYANPNLLRESFDFDNDKFENFLTDKGFYLAKNSRCNYVTTNLSLAATLNMDYINDLCRKVGKEEVDRTPLSQLIRYNKVSEYLKNKGYKSIHISSGWGITKHNSQADYNYAPNFGFDDFSFTFMQTTMLNPIIDNLFNGKTEYQKIVLFSFDKLTKLDNINEPKFVLAHIVCPHPPYVFDEDGNTNPGGLKLDNHWSEKSRGKYISQLKFMNKKTTNVIDQLLKKNKESVIILQSDHGTAFYGEGTDWNNPAPKFIKERSSNFNAIYIPKPKKKGFQSNMTSVNTFRLVFNNIFDDNLEILPDSTYFSSYETPYDLNNVTEVLD